MWELLLDWGPPLLATAIIVALATHVLLSAANDLISSETTAHVLLPDLNSIATEVGAKLQRREIAPQTELRPLTPNIEDINAAPDAQGTTENPKPTTGTLQYRAPPSTFIGDSFNVSATIYPDGGHGLPPVDPVVTRNLDISEVMTVRLNCPGDCFEVQALDDEKQFVLSSTQGGVWQWRVRAKKRGTHKLELRVYRHRRSSEGIEGAVRCDPETFLIKVKVRLVPSWAWILVPAGFLAVTLLVPTVKSVFDKSIEPWVTWAAGEVQKFVGIEPPADDTPPPADVETKGD